MGCRAAEVLGSWSVHCTGGWLVPSSQGVGRAAGADGGRRERLRWRRPRNRRRSAVRPARARLDSCAAHVGGARGAPGAVTWCWHQGLGLGFQGPGRGTDGSCAPLRGLVHNVKAAMIPKHLPASQVLRVRSWSGQRSLWPELFRTSRWASPACVMTVRSGMHCIPSPCVLNTCVLCSVH